MRYYVSRSKLIHETIKAKGFVKKLMRQCNTLWRYRPIHEGLMRYAALDFVMLYLVKDAFEEKLSLTGIHLEKLLVASERYVVQLIQKTFLITFRCLDPRRDVILTLFKG